jgi:hypothetical protein
MMRVGASLGKITGRAEVRGPDGTLKGYIELSGETHLSPEELSERLGINVLVEKDSNGSDSRSSDT